MLFSVTKLTREVTQNLRKLVAIFCFTNSKKFTHKLYYYGNLPEFFLLQALSDEAIAEGYSIEELC